MKSKIIMAGLMVVLALALFACSTTPQRLVVIAPVDDSSASEEVEIAAAGSLVVHLDSNPTTGFKWELAGISDQAVLEQKGEAEFVPPEEAIPGAGGKEIWTFEALKAGTATVYLEYSRPWEGGEKAEWTYTLTVTVK